MLQARRVERPLCSDDPATLSATKALNALCAPIIEQAPPHADQSHYPGQSAAADEEEEEEEEEVVCRRVSTTNRQYSKSRTTDQPTGKQRRIERQFSCAGARCQDRPTRLRPIGVGKNTEYTQPRTGQEGGAVRLNRVIQRQAFEQSETGR